MSRLNIGIDPELRLTLETLRNTINGQRAAKGLEPVTMRTVIHAIANRVAAMDTVFLCGELIKKEQ